MMKAPVGFIFVVTGQEQGDRQRGADAGQDADRRPEHGADERPEEVQRRERDDEPVGELGQGVHAQTTPSGGKPGQGEAEKPGEEEPARDAEEEPHAEVEEEPARAERPRGEGERERGRDREAEGADDEDGDHAGGDGHPERRAGGRAGHVGVLRLLGLEALAAGDGERGARAPRTTSPAPMTAGKKPGPTTA